MNIKLNTTDLAIALMDYIQKEMRSKIDLPLNSYHEIIITQIIDGKKVELNAFGFHQGVHDYGKKKNQKNRSIEADVYIDTTAYDEDESK